MITNEQFEDLFRQTAEKLLPTKRSLLGRDRLRNSGYCVLDAVRRSIPGSVVECGTYRGGALAFMSLVNKSINGGKTVWGFDTFKGLPPPGQLDGSLSKGRGFSGDLLATEKDCQMSFELLGMDLSDVRLIPGLFQDTLHTVKHEIGPISVLRLDGDWYDSTKCCLDQLYDQVSTGGWVIIDDYGHWEGCKKAVDEFLESRNLKPQLKQTDYTEVCWIKI